MFGFMDMMGTYDDRKVDRYEDGDIFVSTCSVTDGQKEYETAVAHPQYNGGSMVIVQMYDTREGAQQGHDEWVKTMTADELPNTLVDCNNSEISQMIGEQSFDKEE